MGMSTMIYGVIPADDKYKAMTKAWHACKSAGVAIPNDVIDFFEGEHPNEDGMLVVIEDEKAVSEYDSEMSAGYEVDVTKLDPKFVKIRFVNSW